MSNAVANAVTGDATNAVVGDEAIVVVGDAAIGAIVMMFDWPDSPF